MQEYEKLVSKPALGKDVSGTVDFDAMEEYFIIDLLGQILPAVLSEKGMQTERFNTVENKIQTE